VKSIEKILEDIKPDILITSTIEDVSSIIWKIAHKKNIKVIHILRSYSLLCTNANMYKKENCTHQCNSCSIISKPKKINSQYVDIVVGISDYILKKHKNLGYFQKAKEKVIYNICSDIQLIQKEEKKAEDDRLKIGYLGRIHETKGIDLIFDSLRHFSDEDKGKISLRIAGNGDDKYLSFLSKIAQKNNIETLFVGSVNQYDFLNRIDLLIVPSKWQEPFGRVIVESIMSSVPVLVSNKGGMPELLEENPDFIFNDAHELSDKISKFIKNELVFNFQINRFLTEKIMNDWHDLINQ
ncbi:glycosyltransferase, partial [Klebsiella michiganensis]|uniref:glycosyltransferase n=2 Tax=Klebsiella/Raoultella group TaxID=2890311 RepID=UPI001BD4C6DB